MNRIVLLSVAVLIGLTAGCQKAPPAIAKTAPPQVVVAFPVARTVTDFEDFTGHVEATQIADLRAQVTGYLKEVHFRDGADVKKDALLFEIDPVTYQAEFEKSNALVTQAQAKLDRLNRDYNRANLATKGTVTQEEIERIMGDRDEAAAAVKVAIAGRNLARQNVEFTRIRAPFAGRLSKRVFDPGNLIKANDTILTNLVVMNPVYATFDVDERTVLRLRRLIQEGKVLSARDNPVDVQVGLADEDGHSLTARIEFADNHVDTGTGTLLIRARLENKPRQPTGPMAHTANALREALGRTRQYLLSPGLFLRIRVPIGAPRSGLLIPEEALASDQGQKFLFVVNATDEVERRAVTLGPQVEQFRVIDAGLTSTDRVIVNGLQRVRPGVKVNPVQPTAKP